jgi:hypothetical protein
MNATEIDFTAEQIVDGNEILWRGMIDDWITQREDGTYRPSSAAFKSENKSVDIASKTTKKNR